ncbi:MAG: hypothetical protein FWD15_03755 [Alphaproteobacteria bacterium]|nr:hypothetical protein [Alphaproteobacteria bacterium]
MPVSHRIINYEPKKRTNTALRERADKKRIDDLTKARKINGAQLVMDVKMPAKN